MKSLICMSVIGCMVCVAQAQLSIPSTGQLLGTVRSAVESTKQPAPPAQTPAVTDTPAQKASNANYADGAGPSAAAQPALPVEKKKNNINKNEAGSDTAQATTKNRKGKLGRRMLTESEHAELVRKRGVGCDYYGNCMD